MLTEGVIGVSVCVRGYDVGRSQFWVEESFGFRVWGFEWGFRVRDWGLGSRFMGFKVWPNGSGFRGLAFGVGD